MRDYVKNYLHLYILLGNIAGGVFKEKNKRWFESAFFEFVIKNKDKPMQNVNANLISIYDYLVEPELKDDFFLEDFSGGSKDDGRGRRKKTMFLNNKTNISKKSSTVSAKGDDEKELYRKGFRRGQLGCCFGRVL
jgi:hypothetical protein